MAINLQTDTRRQLFNPDQWAKVQQNPTGRLDDATWSQFTPTQRSAFIALRKDMQSDQFGQPGGVKPQGDRLTGGNGGAHFVGRDPVGGGGAAMPTIAEVITQAKAAPGNAKVHEPWGALPPGRMMVMSMNVENLFREADDPTHDDKEFTVAAGYTQEKFYRHLDNIASVIKSVNGGKGPDIIATIEVEDKTALQKLVDLKLPDLGYRTIALEEGQDARGIDVGLITKYPLWAGTKPSLLLVPNLGGQRGILRTELNVEGQRTVVYVNHWKSMRDGEEISAKENVQIAALLKSDIAATVAADPDAKIMAMGDFNTKFYGGNQSAMTELGSSKTGDKVAASQLWDATNTIPARRADGVNHPLLPEGTHGYRGDFDFLDRFMVNGNASGNDKGLKLDPDSVVVIPTPGRYFGRDNSTNPNGLSDHKPVVAQFDL